MKARRTEIRFRHSHEARPVKIIADAAISTCGVHGGRLLPLLLLDTSDRPDIAEFIRIHSSSGPGDVEIQWGQIDGHEGTVGLFLTLIRPVELMMWVEFDIVKQGILVEQALTGRGIYLAKAESPDDRLMKGLDRPKIIVEIGDTGFQRTWDDLFHKYLAKDFRNKGLSRPDARRAARSAIEELRKVGRMRLRDVEAEPDEGTIRP